MDILKSLSNQSLKYFFLLFIIIFLIYTIFFCFVYTVKAIELPKDFHNSSNSCSNEESLSISQNNYHQNNRKSIFVFNSIIAEKLFNLNQQKQLTFIFLENLNNSQTSQLLTVAKIE